MAIFGSDLAVSGFFLSSGTALWIAANIYTIFTDETIETESFGASSNEGNLVVAGQSDSLVYWTYISFLISSCLFFVGSMTLLYASTKRNINSLLSDIVIADIQRLTFAQRYFTGNKLLIASWMFILAAMSLYVSPCYAYYLDEINFMEMILFLFLVTSFFLVMLLLMYAVCPQHLQERGGQGSTLFLQTFCCGGECCDRCGPAANQIDNYNHRNIRVKPENWIQYHFGCDLLATGWLFSVYVSITFMISISFLFIFPSSLFSWLTVGAAFLVLIGSFTFIYSAYNLGSTELLDLLFCNHEKYLVDIEDHEEDDLVPK